MRYMLIAIMTIFAANAIAQEPSTIRGEKIEELNEKPDLKKDAPRPTPKRWPPKLQKMYRHAHPHPAVVGVMRPYESRGDVYVNSPGATIHEEKTRYVHGHAVKVPEEEAREMGYRDAHTKIPRNEPSDETKAMTCCADHGSESECTCCDSCPAPKDEVKEEEE